VIFNLTHSLKIFSLNKRKIKKFDLKRYNFSKKLKIILKTARFPAS